MGEEQTKRQMANGKVQKSKGKGQRFPFSPGGGGIDIKITALSSKERARILNFCLLTFAICHLPFGLLFPTCHLH